MKKTKKIISIILITVLFTCALILLCSCLPYEIVHVDGVYALVYDSGNTATVYGFDKSEHVGVYEAQVCYVPEKIYYDGESYTVTELSVGEERYGGELVVGGHVKKLVIPKTVTYIDLFGFNRSDTFDYLEEIEVHKDNQYYASFGGALYSKDFTTLIMYPPAKRDTTMTIHSTTTEIYDSHWNYCNKYVEKVSVGAGNTVFSDMDGVLLSHGGTKLEYVPYGHGGVLELPNGVQTIASMSLRYANVEHMYIPASVNSVELVGDIMYNPFRYVANLYFEEAEPQYIAGWSRYLNEVQRGVSREQFQELVNSTEI